MEYDVNVMISRPIGEVFDAFVDIERVPNWAEIVEARLLTSPPIRVGSRFVEVFPIGPWQYAVTSEVLQLERPHTVAFRSVSAGRVAWSGRADFDDDGAGGTRLRARGRVTLRGLGFLELLLSGELQRNETRELRKLKELLEQPADAAALA